MKLNRMIPVFHFAAYTMEKRAFRLTLVLDGQRPGHDRENLRLRMDPSMTSILQPWQLFVLVLSG